MAIAPNIALSISEIAPQLRTARANVLQFALFNSCSGMGIANSLIDLGLSQVAVMREPIHNQVAQVFLIQFLQALADYQNVHQALITTEKYLKTEKKAEYPSAYLIPSLFSHPDARPFQFQPWGWQGELKKWLPNRKEAIALGALCLLSILSPVQNFLLERRVLIQSIYRYATSQLPTTTPVTLIHIDEASLTKAEIKQPVPMDRRYLASIVDRLVAADAQIIGIDYLFDRPQANNDPILAEAIRNGVEQNQTWFVFGAYKQIDGQEVGVAPETKIGDPNWTVQGYTDGLPNYLSLPPSSCDRACPFAYLLATLKSIERQLSTLQVPQPNLNNRSDLRQQVYQYIDTNYQDFKFIQQIKLSPLTSLSQYFAQQWLRPIQDFSFPPDLVYDRLPAWQLLDSTQSLSAQLQNRVVIIGAGGYAQAGLSVGSDNFATPLAVNYWYLRRNPSMTENQFTGSELLAYMTHNLINRRLVVPIPDLWLVVISLLIAKSIKLSLERKNFSSKLLFLVVSSITIIYGWVGLQIYIFSQAILLPWLLPSLALWIYLLPALKKSHE